MDAEQLELPLWAELQSARLMPEAVNLSDLLNQMEQAIAQLPEPIQLRMAGEALLQLVELYSARAEILISEWEDAYRDPVLPQGTFSDLVRQTMTIDLSDLMEPEPPRKQRIKPEFQGESSVVAPVEKEAVLAMLEQLEGEAPKKSASQAEIALEQALAIAHEESVSEWVQLIYQWIKARTLQSEISFMELVNGLQMPWSHLWLGLLLGNFELEQRGEFYSAEIWIRCGEEIGGR